MYKACSLGFDIGDCEKFTFNGDKEPPPKGDTI